MTNTNGEIVAKHRVIQTVQERMEIYDNLQPEMRQLLRDSPFSMGVSAAWIGRKLSPADINSYRRRLYQIKRESALATYGSKHPDTAVKAY